MTNHSNRIILKIPGSAFNPSLKMPVEKSGTDWIANEIKSLMDLKLQVASVLGSSNLWSGAAAPDAGIGQASSDMMGMLATMANALALRDGLLNIKLDPRIFTSLRCDQAASPYIRGKVLSALEKNKAVILAGGTGNPFFRADTAAALRASELNCSKILRATPAKEINTILNALKGDFSIDNALKLNIIDSTALAFCKESKIDIVFFQSNINNSAVLAFENKNSFTVFSK